MGGLEKASFSSGTQIYKLVEGVGVSVQMSGVCLTEGTTFRVSNLNEGPQEPKVIIDGFSEITSNNRMELVISVFYFFYLSLMSPFPLKSSRYFCSKYEYLVKIFWWEQSHLFLDGFASENHIFFPGIS